MSNKVKVNRGAPQPPEQTFLVAQHTRTRVEGRSVKMSELNAVGVSYTKSNMVDAIKSMLKHGIPADEIVAINIPVVFL